MAPKKKELAIKECLVCGEKFHQKRYASGPDATFKRRKYCSKKCSGQNHRVMESAKSRRRKDVIQKYGGVCQCCGESHWQFLSLDHINNDGAKHRRDIGQSRIYKWAEDNNYPHSLRVLCFNCNMARAFYGKCPHELSKSI